MTNKNSNLKSNFIFTNLLSLMFSINIIYYHKPKKKHKNQSKLLIKFKFKSNFRHLKIKLNFSQYTEFSDMKPNFLFTALN